VKFCSAENSLAGALTRYEDWEMWFAPHDDAGYWLLARLLPARLTSGLQRLFLQSQGTLTRTA